MKSFHKWVGLWVLALALCVGGATSAIAQEKVAATVARDAVCTKCHNETWEKPVLSIYQTRHGVKADSRTPGCQTCHGASDEHVKTNSQTKPDVVFAGKGKSTPEAQNTVCETCHKSGNRMNWTGSQHETRDLTCTGCHEVHTPNQKVMSKATQAEVCFNCHKTQRAQARRISTHPLTNSVLDSSAKMTCSDCHNPHGSTGPNQLIKNSVNETCFTCHAEKRGPFLFEHSPVIDDCTNCHSVHGSNTAPLLKARTPFLCQQCHQDHGASLKSGASVVNGPGGVLSGNSAAAALAARTTGTAFGKSPSVQGNGRMCLNCHVMIHGSNAPSGAFFNR
jgi:DmsE family decaheme c-type cytochrome